MASPIVEAPQAGPGVEVEERKHVLALAAPALVPAVLAALAALGLAAASVYRHEHFGSNAYDLGIYDQTIWGYSRLEPTIDNTVLGTPNLLLDHFQPILAVLAPLY